MSALLDDVGRTTARFTRLQSGLPRVPVRAHSSGQSLQLYALPLWVISVDSAAAGAGKVVAPHARP